MVRFAECAGAERMQTGTGLGAGMLVGEGLTQGWSPCSGLSFLICKAEGGVSRCGPGTVAWGSLLNLAGPWVPTQTYCSALDVAPTDTLFSRHRDCDPVWRKGLCRRN